MTYAPHSSIYKNVEGCKRSHKSLPANLSLPKIEDDDGGDKNQSRLYISNVIIWNANQMAESDSQLAWRLLYIIGPREEGHLFKSAIERETPTRFKFRNILCMLSI